MMSTKFCQRRMYLTHSSAKGIPMRSPVSGRLIARIFNRSSAICIRQNAYVTCKISLLLSC